MEMERLLKLLDLHSVPTRIVGDRVEADCMECKDGKRIEGWIDVTNWRMLELLHWLGY